MDLMPTKKRDAADRKIAAVMREFNEGSLKSSSGHKVRKREQAIAIALSEAGKSGPARKPARKTGSSKRKPKA
jgi:hypothetical protein